MPFQLGIIDYLIYQLGSLDTGVTAYFFDHLFGQSQNKFFMSGPVGSGGTVVCSG